jgi:hypothetical protein
MYYLKLKEKIIFEVQDLSKVSFMNSDITRVRFHDKVRWEVKDRFRIVEEEILEKSPENVSLGSVMSVYRNLRENYEFRLRYDEAGKFFTREMELKRKYREEFDPYSKTSQIKKNGFFRRNFFSLT